MREKSQVHPAGNPQPRAGAVPKRRRLRRTLVIALLVVLGLGGIGRALLPWSLRGYVNRTLDRSPLYTGRVGEIRVHLWRGAYSIRDVRISKTTGDVPVPFFAAEHVDFALQWGALVHRRLVGRVLMENPELNFVDAPTAAGAQTGADGPWLKMLQDLSPFTINAALIRNGSIHLRAYHEDNPMDIYLSHVQATIENLGNIQDDTKPLVATVHARGLAMDQARFEFKMALDPFSYRPTFQLATRVLGLEVTRINDLALTYGQFDFKHGWLDFVLEMDAKEGRLSGYAKPLFRDVQVLSLPDDAREGNPLNLLWQALLAGTTKVLSNPPRDQFGTLIPFTGDLSGTTTTDILATVGNILRNAFVRAYLPNLERQGGPDAIELAPIEFGEALAVGASP